MLVMPPTVRGFRSRDARETHWSAPGSRPAFPGARPGAPEGDENLPHCPVLNCGEVAHPETTAQDSPASVRAEVTHQCQALAIWPVPGISLSVLAVGGQLADQNDTWCLDANPVSTRGWGVSRDMTRPVLLNAGQRSVTDEGLPVAAKLTHALRMVSASSSCSGLNGSCTHASGRSNR